MKNRSDSLRKMILMALLAAIAYIIVALVRIPVVAFLSYEPKDVVITVGGFLLGPLASFIISLLVSLVEMVTISQTGPIGCLMNLISTCSFACVASIIYKKKHSINGAVMGLLAGTGSTHKGKTCGKHKKLFKNQPALGKLRLLHGGRLVDGIIGSFCRQNAVLFPRLPGQDLRRYIADSQCLLHSLAHHRIAQSGS